MDEAEQYQQRLQAIAEKRRAQEEEERVKRETEEEWLKLAQHKRKCLRDQWLMEATPSTATEAPGIETTPWTSAQTSEEDKSQKQITGENENTSIVDDLTLQITDTHSENPLQVSTVEEENKGSRFSESAVNTRPGDLENGQIERSVLEVERDLKTGATSIKSVASALGATEDGGRMVHVVGNIDDSQCSEEELSQISDAISEDEELGEEREIKKQEGDHSEGVDRTSDTLQVCCSSEVDNEEEVEGKEIEVDDDEWEMVNCRPEEDLDPVVLTFLGLTEAQASSGLGYEDVGDVLNLEQVFITEEEEEENSKINLSNELSPTAESSKCIDVHPEPFPLSSSKNPCLEVTIETVCFRDIMDSEAPEVPKIQPNVSADVLEATKDVPGDSEAAAKDIKTTRAGTEQERASTESLEDEVFQDVPLDGKGETSQTLKPKQSIQKEPEIQAVVTSSVTPTRGGEKSPKSPKMCQCCSVM